MPTEKVKKEKIPYKMIGLHPDLYAELLAIRDVHSQECGFALSWSDFFRRIVSKGKKKCPKASTTDTSSR
jgi:hypothetical protein